MPTLFYFLGLKFFFYANEHQPIHVHVSCAGKEARFQIEPLMLIDNHGLSPRELRIAEMAIEENKEIITLRWKEFFDL